MRKDTIQNILGKTIEKSTCDEVLIHCRKNPEKLLWLMEFIQTNDVRLVHNSAHVFTDLVVENPQFLLPHYSLLMEILKNATNDGATRTIVRLFQFVPISDEIESELYEHCLQLVENPKTAIAIMAFSMTVCAKIAKKYPELAQELIPTIEKMLPNGSAGVKNRGAKVLKELRNLKR